MSDKAALFVGSVMSVLVLLTALVLSWATGGWEPLIGCLIALGIAFVVLTVTLGLCVLADRLFPWDDRRK